MLTRSSIANGGDLTQRGYRVIPQVGAGRYRIDLVVEGSADARLAIECDGDKYHGADKWEDDQRRQRVLERAGWVFWRCFASTYVRRKEAVLDDLLKTISARGIEPTSSQGVPKSIHTEFRRWRSPQVSSEDTSAVAATVHELEGQACIAGGAAHRPADLELATPEKGGSRDSAVIRLRTRSTKPAPHTQALEFFRGDGQLNTVGPGTSFSEQALADYCQRHSLRSKDKRHVNGALWVEHLNPRGHIATQLKAWGFRFAPAKGFWRK